MEAFVKADREKNFFMFREVRVQLWLELAKDPKALSYLQSLMKDEKQQAIVAEVLEKIGHNQYEKSTDGFNRNCEICGCTVFGHDSYRQEYTCKNCGLIYE